MRKAFRLFPQALGVIALALGTLLTPSCTKEYFSDVPDDDAVEMIISLGADTKTTNDGNSTLWAEEDQLTVIHSAAGGSDFTASRFSYIGSNDFSGKVSRLSSTNDWYVIYPYKEGNTAANALSFTFPASQSQSGNASKAHLAGEDFPLVGKTLGVTRGADLTVQTANLLAVAKFNVYNESESNLPIIVKEIQFTAPSPIAGAFTADLTGENPAVAAGSGATKVVKLTVENGAEIAYNGSSDFYMAFAPFEAPAGSKLKLKITAVHPTGLDLPIVFYRTIEVGADGLAFDSGAIQAIGAHFNETSTTNPDAGSGTEVELPVGGEPEDGVYLLVYEQGETSMAFAAFSEYKTQKYAIPVTVVDGVVIPQEDEDLSSFAVSIEVAKDENGNPIQHSNDSGHYAYNVRNSAGQYVFYSTGGGTLDASDALQIKDINEMDIDGTTYKYYHTFVQAEDGVQILSSIYGASGGNKYLLAYTASNGFYYEENNSGQKLHLYLLGGSVKEKQSPYFEPNTVDYDFDVNGAGVLANKPTLKDARTNVSSWESSSPAVASVDASGNVTVHQVGSATITAKLDSDDTYYGATATYTINVTSATVQTWYKADEMVAGQTYLVVSNGYALQNNNGSVAATAVTVSNDIITLNAPAAIIWTATSGSELTNNSQYLRRSSSSSSGGWGGWGGSSSLSIGDKSSTASNNQWTYNADNNYVMSDTYYLYYSTSSNAFTISTSQSSSHIAALYSTIKPATSQNLKFANSTVRWTVGEGGDHVLNQPYAVQTVSGNVTTVTYTSSDTNVATIDGTTLTLKGTGSTTITATAPAGTVNGIEYKEAVATYTLRISTPAPGGFEDLGTFNLENAKVKEYLDRAVNEYTDSNLSTTIVSSFASGASSTNRLDVPNPVTIEWGTQSSGTATITIFSDQALKNEVWVQTATSGSTSAAVFNLIPGKTYYCTVEDNTGYLLKGVFETEGRRRMMKVGQEANMNRANNCRDLGGMVTADGRKIKFNMIFRGTNLDSTSGKSISNYVSPNNSEQGLLANYMNVGYDIDLRAGGKSAFTNDYSVVYVLGNMDASVSSCTKAENARPTIQGFFDAAAAGKASYFHCAIGSDRTGFWGLLIEGLLGVSIKDCSIDYELTSFARNVTSGDRTRNSGLFSDGISFFNKQEGNTLQEKVESYVKGLSNSQYQFTDEVIEAFRNNVLE